MLDTNLALFVEVRLFHSQLYKRIDPGGGTPQLSGFSFFYRSSALPRFQRNSKVGGRNKIKYSNTNDYNAKKKNNNNNNYKHEQQTTHNNNKHTTTNNNNKQTTTATKPMN